MLDAELARLAWVKDAIGFAEPATPGLEEVREMACRTHACLPRGRMMRDACLPRGRMMCDACLPRGRMDACLPRGRMELLERKLARAFS